MISLIFLLVGVAGQVPFLGPCPEIETMDRLDVNRYMGKWYEAERYFAVFEFGGKCVTADYVPSKDGSINIINQQTSALTGIRSTIEGKANMNGRSDDPKLTITFPQLPLNLQSPYWILDTDYDTYSVIWSCNKLGIFSLRNAWILTRSKKPALSSMEKAYSVLDRNSISRAYFIRTDQKNCPGKK
nr:apolipoprotein D-like [Onthophagus taurus]